jgi:large subunit ribosomal protein L25
MSKETPTLEAKTRDRTGTRYTRRLRAAGRLPAVIYGHGTEPLSVSLDHGETIRHLTNGAHVVEVKLDDAKSKDTCLIKDLQFGWMGDNVIHMDLTRVDLDEIVTVNVKISFTGSPEAAKDEGLILTYDMTDLELRCKVRDIPEEIPVNLDAMEESFTVAELVMPDNVEAVPAPEALVCHLVFKAEEEEEEVPVEGIEGEEAAPDAADAPPTSEGGAEDPSASGGGGESGE